MSKRYFNSGLVATITRVEANLGPGIGVHNDYYNVSFSVDGHVVSGKNLLRLPIGFSHGVDSPEAYDFIALNALEDCSYYEGECLSEEGAERGRRAQLINYHKDLSTCNIEVEDSMEGLFYKLRRSNKTKTFIYVNTHIHNYYFTPSR